MYKWFYIKSKCSVQRVKNRIRWRNLILLSFVPLLRPKNRIPSLGSSENVHLSPFWLSLAASVACRARPPLPDQPPGAHLQHGIVGLDLEQQVGRWVTHVGRWARVHAVHPEHAVPAADDHIVLAGVEQVVHDERVAPERLGAPAAGGWPTVADFEQRHDVKSRSRRSIDPPPPPFIRSIFDRLPSERRFILESSLYLWAINNNMRK